MILKLDQTLYDVLEYQVKTKKGEPLFTLKKEKFKEGDKPEIDIEIMDGECAKIIEESK